PAVDHGDLTVPIAEVVGVTALVAVRTERPATDHALPCGRPVRMAGAGRADAQLTARRACLRITGNLFPAMLAGDGQNVLLIRQGCAAIRTNHVAFVDLGTTFRALHRALRAKVCACCVQKAGQKRKPGSVGCPASVRSGARVTARRRTSSRPALCSSESRS